MMVHHILATSRTLETRRWVSVDAVSALASHCGSTHAGKGEEDENVAVAESCQRRCG